MKLHSRTLTALILPALVLLLAVLGQAQESAGSAAPEGTGTEDAESSRPFLWELRRGGSVAYLFGTVHLPDDRVLDLPAEVVEAIERSGALYTEIEANLQTEMAVSRASLLPAGEMLDTIVGEELWDRVRVRLKKHGLHPGLFKPMKPWVVSATLPMLEYLQQMATKAPLDKALYLDAKKAGKTVGGLETVEEQIAAFESFTRAEQVQLLRETLDQLEEYEREDRDLMEETIQAWLSGKLDRLVDLLDEGFGSDPALTEKGERELIWRRNVRLSDRLEARLQEAPEVVAFFAVGALHFPDGKVASERAAGEPSSVDPDGPGQVAGKVAGRVDDKGEVDAVAKKLGMLAILRQRGFEVTRVAPVEEPAGAGSDRAPR